MPLTKDFKELKKVVEKQYIRKPVPLRWQKKYGKFYNKKEVEGISYDIAKSKGIKVDFGKPIKTGKEINWGKELDFGNDIDLGRGLDLGK